MFGKLKHFIQRILPSSKSQVNDRFDRLKLQINNLNEATQNKLETKILSSTSELEQKTLSLASELEKKTSFLADELEQRTASLASELEQKISSLTQDNNNLQKYVADLDKKVVSSNNNTVDRLGKLDKKLDLLMNNIQTMKSRVDEINKKTDAVRRRTDESIWAVTWHDTIKESEWLKNQMFSPGRWAIGYQYLYTLYRVLNEFRPNNILELGLGQSTKMISQYVEYSKETRHIVVEHDMEWEQFYKNNNPICERTEIKHLDLAKEQFKEDTAVTVYNGFKDAFQNKKFDFISIDAPFGGEAIIYARIDVLKILPQCLENMFVIMVDDYNRSGEKEMIKEMRKILDENGIKYSCGLYSGSKDSFIIAAQEYKFLCSM